MISALLQELTRSHFPNPPASEAEIAAFEKRVGWQLDEVLRCFYLHCNGARLFRDFDAPYQLLPLEKVIRTRVAIYGSEEEEWGPASWYVVCDVGDTDFVSIDHTNREKESYPLFDCFHESFYLPDKRRKIAHSFSDFLERALGSQGHLYWLSSPFRL